MADLLKITGLWESVDKNGNPVLSGSMGGVRVTIFKNTYKKEGSNQPDYNLYFGENKRQEEGSGNGNPQNMDDVPF